MCCPEDPGCSPAHPGAKVLLCGDPPVSQCARSLTFWDLEGDLGQQPEALTLHLWPSEVLARFGGIPVLPGPWVSGAVLLSLGEPGARGGTLRSKNREER